ncbi:MAG: hypothetical protein AABY93_12015 [Bacteroidota bacterium]
MHLTEGKIYHIYNRGNNKQKIFFKPENSGLFERANLREALMKLPVRQARNLLLLGTIVLDKISPYGRKDESLIEKSRLLIYI